eukprot:maker-scaffold2190_size19107-snap-gene-0.5 protein:Tk02200 transcript:maker-scaffold2190_size19107-snap-gene-0.5-mRNA-1 annotation:"e3 ubiquitin-protein ligase trim33-like"
MSDPYQSYYMGAGPAPGYYPPSPTPSHAAGAPAHPGFYPAYPPARPPPPGFPAPHGTRPPGAGPSGGFPPAPPLKACGSVPRAMVNLPKGLDVRRATGGPSAPVVPPPVVDARRPHPGLSARLPPGISMSKASGISMSKASTGAGASIHPIRPLSQMRPGPVGPTPRTTPLSRLAGLSGISMQAPRNTPPAPSPTVAPTTSMSPLPTRRPGAGTMAGEAVASGPARPLGPTGLDKLKNLNLLVKPQAHAPPPLQRAPGSGVTMSPARSVAWPPVTSPSSTSVSMTPPSGFEAPRTANYEYKAEVKDVQSGELGFDLTKVKTEPGTEAQSHFAAAYVRQRAAQMRTERAKERPTPTLASPSWPTEAEAPIKSPSGGESDSGKTMESGASDGPASAPPPPHDPNTSSLLNSEAKPCVDDQPSGEPPAKEESVPNSSSHSPTSKPDSGPETKDHLIANAPINGSESLKADEGPLDHAEDNVQSSTQPSLDPIGAASHPSDNNEESSEPKNEAANFEEPMDQCDPDEMDDHEEHNVAAPHKIDTVEEPQTDRSVKDESDDLVNVSNVSSPFKKPNIVGFNDSHSQSGHSQTESRVHHESDGSVSDVSESGKSIMESNQYQNHLAFCKKPLVGQDTVCIICLTRCCEKEPKLLTCLHSACQSCFQDAIDEAKKEHKIVENVSIDEDVAPIEQEVFISCPLCKVSTSEAELAENLFIEPDGGDDAVGIQVCESCEDANPADSRCTDCEENLCEDCVKAHQRVKITKDHTLEKIALPQRRSAKPSLAPKDFFCSFHPTDRRTVFCNSCETLICNECKSAPSHLDHSMRASYEVAPEIRDALSQQISDIRLKRNTLDENRSLLGAKLNELEIKEKSLNTLLAEVKDYLLSRIEARFRGLTSELSRTVRQTRRAIDGRKATLDRFFVQTDYAIAFVDNALVNCEEDNAVLVAKRSLERQLRRLKKVDPSTGLSDNTREFKMDLYFQHFGGSQVHTSLESVLKQVLSDVKILAAPPPMPETRPKEVVAHPASSFQVTPTKNASVFMSSSAATNPGLLPQSPQITPTKNMGVARVPMRASPINPRGRGAGSSPGGRGVGSSPGGRGKNASISSRGASPARARPVSTVRGRAPMGGRGNGPRGSMRGVKPAPVSARGRGHRGASMTSVSARGRGRGPVTTMKSNRGASTMATRGKPSKGVIGQGVTISPAQPQTQSQTKKHILVLPAGTSAVPTSLLVTKDSVSGKKPQVGARMLMQPSPAQQMQQNPAQQMQQAQDVNTHAMSVPPKVDNSFKIKLPGASKNRGSTNTPAEVVDLESPENNKEENTQKSSSVTLNTITIASVEGHYNEGATRTTESTRTDDPKSSTGSSAIISLLPASEPDKGKVKQNGNEIPDLSSLLEDDYELSGSPADWVQGSHEEGTKDPDEAKSQPHKNEEVAPKDSQVHSEGTVPTDSKIDADFVSTADLGSRSSPQDIKLELKLGSLSSRPTSKTSKRSKRKGKSQLALKQEASGNDDENRWQTDDNGDEAWCAICHDGGDLLYCCDRCPKVYHLYCYIPPLTSEPPDDWVCLMCATFDEIIQFPDTPDPQSGHLSNRDLKICRRLLFEVYNQYPQSVPFRDCSDLNFPEYLAMVKQPIALDIIKERLSADNPEQYESKEMFLKDLRKMFKNCYSFHEKDSEFYRSAKELEEYLDKQLETWLPDFAYDQNLSGSFSQSMLQRNRSQDIQPMGGVRARPLSKLSTTRHEREQANKLSTKCPFMVGDGFLVDVISF